MSYIRSQKVKETFTPPPAGTKEMGIWVRGLLERGYRINPRFISLREHESTRKKMFEGKQEMGVWEWCETTKSVKFRPFSK